MRGCTAFKRKIMNVLIIEDEHAAAGRLTQLIHEIRPDWMVIGTLESIREALDWFGKHREPDLVFSDVQLADGIAFEIYRVIRLNCPVIFTTAYDTYAIQAFKLNSVDYLLKPILKEHLKEAIVKLEKMQSLAGRPDDLSRLASEFMQQKSKTSNRILVKFGQKLKAIDTENVAYFYIDGRSVMLKTPDGKSYPVDETLDQLESMLDKNRFFRANRQIIVRFEAIRDMVLYSKSRIRLELSPPSESDVIVSESRCAEFKDWLKGTS